MRPSKAGKKTKPWKRPNTMTKKKSWKKRVKYGKENKNEKLKKMGKMSLFIRYFCLQTENTCTWRCINTK